MDVLTLAASALLGTSPVVTADSGAMAADVPAAEAPEAAPLPAEPEGGGSTEDSHSLEIYGFAQFDGIQDFDRVNPDWEAALRPSRIPTTKGQYGSDGQ